MDDFAFRKGRVYGSILVDLRAGRPIDLLPDRSADTFAAWLQEHPGVEIIVRDRSTEYARGASEGAPEAHQAATKPRASQIDRFAPYLEERWRAGCTNASQLWREVVAQGYTGTRKQVARWAEHQRTTPAATRPSKEQAARPGQASQEPYTSTRLPSPRALAWLLLHEPKRLEGTDMLVLEHLRSDPMVAEAHDLAQELQRLVRQRQPERFDQWLERCARAAAAELQNFAFGMRREEEAIRAALSEPWSTGPVEGQITRLKSIKRQTYGRASFELLRVRVLNAA